MLPDLRKWQKKALVGWSSSRSGIAKVVTGAGKTVFGLACYEKAREAIPDLKLLVVVPTVPLLDQWIAECRSYLDVPNLAVCGHGGGRSDGFEGLVHVAVLNTARNIAEQLTGVGRWMLIVDECHRTGSPENRRAIQISAEATLGLSATPERQFDDFFEEVIEPALGPVFFNYSHADALRDGVMAPFNLTNFSIPLSDYEQSQIERVEKNIAIKFSQGFDVVDDVMKQLFLRRARISQSAAARIPAVVQLAENNAGQRGLVFHESIAAADSITEELLKRNHRVAAYHSQISPVTRMANLDLFRDGQIDLLVTCRALDEGLDVPDAELGIIAASTSSTRQRVQRMGRVLRPSAGKVCASVNTLYALHSEKRRLEEEVQRLEGLAGSRWYSMEFA